MKNKSQQKLCLSNIVPIKPKFPSNLVTRQPNQIPKLSMSWDLLSSFRREFTSTSNGLIFKTKFKEVKNLS